MHALVRVALVLGADLEEDVGGVEVAVADAFGVDVRHALRDVLQDVCDSLPVGLYCVWVEEPGADGVREAPSVAVLLHHARGSASPGQGRPEGFDAMPSPDTSVVKH